MKTGVADRVMLVTILVGLSSVGALGADEIKAGKWQFTTEMEMPGMPPSAAGAQARPVGGAPMTSTICIDASNPVPAETQQGNVQCKLDKMERNGGSVTWAMTCNSPQGPVQSAGSGRYTGDTMAANLTARVPGPNGQVMNAPGRIIGRYLGPCGSK
jgi:hypothetical protein